MKSQSAPPAGWSASASAILRLREAFQRDSRNPLDVTVEVERIDADAAIIASHFLGLSVLRLANRFAPTATGTRYVTEMVISSDRTFGPLEPSRLIRSRVLASDMALAWAPSGTHPLIGPSPSVEALISQQAAAVRAGTSLLE